MLDFAFTECASVFCGCFCASAARYGIAKDIGIVPIIVAELKFRDYTKSRIIAENTMDLQITAVMRLGRQQAGWRNLPVSISKIS
jgi:hypothetical protein